MIKDTQVKGLMKMLSSGLPLETAAMKSGMSENTARKYRTIGRMPSQIHNHHEWKTRTDPFEEVWSTEVEPLLTENQGLEAKTVFELLQERHAGKFRDGQLRTLQRRFRDWRAIHGNALLLFIGSSPFHFKFSVGSCTIGEVCVN